MMLWCYIHIVTTLHRIPPLSKGVFGIGGSHWPDIAQHYYCVHAPLSARWLWWVITPLAGEHVRGKVSFHSGVPLELVEALGGEDAVRRMEDCSPHTRALEKKSHTAAGGAGAEGRGGSWYDAGATISNRQIAVGLTLGVGVTLLGTFLGGLWTSKRN